MMGNPTIGLDFQNHNMVFGVNFNRIDKEIQLQIETVQNQEMNEEKIAQLEAQLTGDMFADMDIKDQIHKLKLEAAGGSCDIDDPECEACGS